MNRIVSILGLLALYACNGPESEQGQTMDPTNERTMKEATEGADNILSAGGSSLSEPKGPIDSKGAEAAGQVVQHYGALIEQRRWAEAEKLWGNTDTARDMTADLRRYPEVHLEIGDLGEMEGAAGSIYVTVPVTFYGRNAAGPAYRRPAIVNLRRVNDVPGSTEEQRRWHIDDIVFVRML